VGAGYGRPVSSGSSRVAVPLVNGVELTPAGRTLLVCAHEVLPTA